MPPLKRVLLGILLLIGWIVGWYLFRYPFKNVFLFMYADEHVPERLSYTMTVLYYGFRVVVVVPMLIAVGGGMKLLQAYAPRLLVYRQRLFSNRPPSRKRQKIDASSLKFVRFIFATVIISALIPASWVPSPYLAAWMVLLISIGLLSIEWIGAMGIGQAFKEHYGYRQGVNIPNSNDVPFPIFAGISMFVGLMMFLGCHLPFYAAAVWTKLRTFEESRHALLMLHGLIVWTFLPLYVFSVRNREVLLNFLKINLWFLPAPKFAKTAERVGGGASGGAGASGSF